MAFLLTCPGFKQAIVLEKVDPPGFIAKAIAPWCLGGSGGLFLGREDVFAGV